MRNKIILLLIVILAINLTACTDKEESKEIVNVFAAASLTSSIEEIKEIFEEQYNVNIQLNLASSSRLKTQIIQGGGCDIFLSANKKQFEKVSNENMVEKGDRFASNSIVVIMPKDGSEHIKSIEDLSQNHTIILAQKEVPIGNYTLQVIDKLSNLYGSQFKSNILSNVVSEENDVKQVVSKILLNEADAGFVYYTDVTEENEEKLKVLEIPSEYNIEAEYWMAKINDSNKSKAVDQFYEFILSNEGQAVFQNYNFKAIK